MDFEETFKRWNLGQKVEWALGPNICNLSENMRSIIVDLKAENEQLKRDLEHARSYKNVMKTENQKLKSENEKLKGELKQTEAQDQVVIEELRKTLHALWMARALRAKLLVQLDMEGHWDYIVSQEAQGKTPKAELDRWFSGWVYAERKCREKAVEFE